MREERTRRGSDSREKTKRVILQFFRRKKRRGGCGERDCRKCVGRVRTLKTQTLGETTVSRRVRHYQSLKVARGERCKEIGGRTHELVKKLDIVKEAEGYSWKGGGIRHQLQREVKP